MATMFFHFSNTGVAEFFVPTCEMLNFSPAGRKILSTNRLREDEFETENLIEFSLKMTLYCWFSIMKQYRSMTDASVLKNYDQKHF